MARKSRIDHLPGLDDARGIGRSYGRIVRMIQKDEQEGDRIKSEREDKDFFLVFLNESAEQGEQCASGDLPETTENVQESD